MQICCCKAVKIMNARQLAPWTIRPRQLAPDLQTTRPNLQTTRPRSSDNSPTIFRQLAPIFRQLAPIWKHLCYVGKIFFYAHKVIISWKKKKVCFLKNITRPRLTFVAFDCNDRVNTSTWPFRNPATTFEVIEVKQTESNCLCCFGLKRSGSYNRRLQT